MERERIYRDRAELYDLIYHWKDYDAETEQLIALLADLGVSPGARVVEAACGTGQHLSRLRAAGFEVAGFDINDGVLDIARRRVGDDVPLLLADMADLEVSDLGPQFDALICLFSSIGYLTPGELPLAAANFARALRPGGALIVEPWFTPDAFRPGKASLQTYASERLKIARGCVSEVQGRRSRTDMHYLVVPEGGPVERFTERHDLWLSTAGELLSVFTRAGFVAQYEPDGLMPGRGLYLGAKRDERA